MSARTKRKRRQERQVLRFGPQAKRRHAKRGGRTGRIRSRNEPGKSPLGLLTSSPLTAPASVEAMLTVMRR